LKKHLGKITNKKMERRRSGRCKTFQSEENNEKSNIKKGITTLLEGMQKVAFGRRNKQNHEEPQIRGVEGERKLRVALKQDSIEAELI